jgi:hypothetical protein
MAHRKILVIPHHSRRSAERAASVRRRPTPGHHLAGGFFVDIMNALVTKTFLALPMMQQGAS